MQWYIYALLTLFVTLSHGQTTHKVPTIPVCDQNIISTIKNYWKTVGKPENALKTLAESGPLTVVHTSYNRTNPITKCLHLHFADRYVTLTIDSKTGNPPIQLNYSVEQSGDIIRGKYPLNDFPEGRWDLYTVSIKNGVVVIYVCGEGKEGTDDPPITAVMVTDSHKNPAEVLEVTNMSRVINGWGIDFVRSYGTECFN